MPLPPAAQRWLRRSLPDAAPVPAEVRVLQRGAMEANDRWLKFKSTATYRARPMAFEWRARLGVLPGLWVIARDGHADGEGWGGAWLMGLKVISERRGPEVLPIQLVRNIAELAYLPDMARADESLGWSAIGDDAFEISADAQGITRRVRFDVDDGGDIVKAWSPARPVDAPDGYDDVPWRCDFTDHRDFDGLRIPTRVVATYEFEEEPWEYFRAQITEVQRIPAPGS